METILFTKHFLYRHQERFGSPDKEQILLELKYGIKRRRSKKLKLLPKTKHRYIIFRNKIYCVRTDKDLIVLKTVLRNCSNED